MLKFLCTPALIYLLFSITQIVIDIFKKDYNVALVKFAVAFIFTILLNYFCKAGLGIVSWIIVFVPFILMSVIVTYILTFFGIDPNTKKVRIIQDGEILKTEEETKQEESQGTSPPIVSNISATYSEPTNQIVINYTSSKGGFAWCKAIKKGGPKPTIYELKEGIKHRMNEGDDNECIITDYEDENEYIVYMYVEDYLSNGISEEDMLATSRFVKTTSLQETQPSESFENIQPYKSANASFGNFFHNNSKTYKERKKHINHIEKILTSLNENDNTAYFIVQAETCANKKTNAEYEKCLKRVIQEIHTRIKDDETKEQFIKKLHDSKINVIGIKNKLI